MTWQRGKEWSRFDGLFVQVVVFYEAGPMWQWEIWVRGTRLASGFALTQHIAEKQSASDAKTLMQADLEGLESP